ncbi:hypothetical protein ACFCXF_07635 [Streptomyces virginiae]|uniref:hypothetical protein n=1 Tax=Streptomyces virginiae TaxID=1961 RepID=UPI0035D86385
MNVQVEESVMGREAVHEVLQQSVAVPGPGTGGGDEVVYALVEPGTGEDWQSRSAVECLGDGTHLGVPDIGRDRVGPGRALYWASTPGPGAYFCRVAAVRLLVRVGRARLAEGAAR